MMGGEEISELALPALPLLLGWSRGGSRGRQWGTWGGGGRKEPLHANPREWKIGANGVGEKKPGPTKQL